MDKSALILELRQKTGAGMMDCKKALDEASGSLDAAITVLRKKGVADAAKRSARAAKEGAVAYAASGKAGALIELNCETDFVARTDEFKNLACALAGKAASGELKTPEQAVPLIQPAIAKLGENITLRRLERFEHSGAGLIDGYIHIGAKVGALVELSAPASGAASPELATLAKDLNLQIAGASPRYLNRASAPPADIDKEREIYAEVLRKEGKPEAQIPKIVEGKLNKLFFQAFCLLDQMWQRDPKIGVAQLVKDASGKLGGPVEVKRFVRYQLGE